MELREAGDAEAACVALLELVAQRPEDAVVHHQTAWADDVLGREAEAVTFYESALALGLDGEDRAGALLGLGSSYRAVAGMEDAQRTLRAGGKSSVATRGRRVPRDGAR